MEPGKPTDIRNSPAYTIGEAARYIRIPAITLQTWALGRSYPTEEGDRRWLPLFEIADRDRRLLSFVNLVESNTLAAMRRDLRLRIPKIRAALDYVKRKHGIARPLCDQQFATDLIDLFVEHFGQLVNVSRDGQVAMGEMVRAALGRVERDDRGTPIRLFAPAARRGVDRRSSHSILQSHLAVRSW